MEPPLYPLSSRPERTRISYYATLDISARAAFIKESRMTFASATKPDRKSGVAKWRDLRYSLSPTRTQPRQQSEIESPAAILR